MTDDELLGALDKAVGANNMEVAQEIGLLLKQSRMKNEPLPSYKLGQEGMPDAIRSVAQDEGLGAQRLAGIGSAPMIAGHAIAELAGAKNADDVQNWKGVRDATSDTGYGSMAGNALMFGAAPTGAVGPAAVALGAKTLPRWGQIADMTATQGATAAGTTPGDAGERLAAGLLGSAGGAAPAVVGAAQTGRRIATQAGRQLGVGDGLRRELGADADPLVAALAKGSDYPTAGIGVRPSAAMLTRNPILETMETGSRVRTGDQWTQLDRMNAAARWKALEDAAGTPEDLVRMRAARDVFTTPMREEALGATGGALQVGKGTAYSDLNEKLSALTTGANRPNPAVQTMVKYVQNELKQGVTPEQLYTIRKTLTDGIAAAPTSELSQAARAARPQRMELIGLIDETLNDISQGGWSKYLESYKIASPMISSKGALQKVRDALASGRPEGEVPASMGERAAPYTFGRKVEQFGTKEFGSKEIDQLTPQHRQLVESLLLDLTAQQGVMSAKGTLGSATASNMANAGRVHQLTNSMVDAAGNVIPVVGGTVAASIKGGMARQSEESLARMLQDPEVLAKALRDAAKAQALLNKSGRAGAAASAAVRSQ